MIKKVKRETKMKNNLVRIGIFLVLFSLLIFTGIIPGRAFTGYYFNGGYKKVSNKGAAITCETQNPYVAPDSWISVWAMTCNLSLGSNENYAQVGWLKEDGWSNPRYFYEYSSKVTGARDQRLFATAQSGSHNDFMVGSDSTYMYFKLNGTELGKISLSTLNWTPDTVEFFGEPHDFDDQCPGSVSNPVTMGNAQYKTTSGSWVSAGVTEYHDLSTMANNIDTGDITWEIWDTRYEN